MPKPTGSSNAVFKRLVNELKKREQYAALVDVLLSPRRKLNEFNISDLERASKGVDAVATAGKVLGGGDMTKALTVFARSYSSDAKRKIAEAGGKAFGLEALLKEERAVKVLR